MQVSAKREASIKAIDERASQPALIRRFEFEQAQHIASPILIIAAIADHPNGVRFSEHFGERRDISKIVLRTNGALAMSGLGWQHKSEAEKGR